MGKINKTKNKIDSSIFRMMAIFVAQYINTAIMFIIVYHSFLSANDVAMHEKAHYFLKGPFDEFNVRWYLVVGVPLIMAIGI